MFRHALLTATVAFTSAFTSHAQQPAETRPAPVVAQAEPKIQIAILLDTSGSMDGLLNQTREQLWRIATTFATAKKNGRAPRLELALYHYGNQSISASQHYVQQLVPLTTDLDKVSEALFKLSTNGGDEFCGAAISHAVSELSWSSNPKDLKLIYIAGNEAFTQGPIAFRDAVKRSIGQGIVVNTIFAGAQSAGVAEGWAEAPKLADGQFLSIDSNKAVVRIDAPQDAELARLSGELNKTYLGYGAQGRAAPARQAAQDANAAGSSAQSLSVRVKAKASALYRNAEWDLVDARKEGKALKDVAPAELPKEMQDMDGKQREAFVDQKASERAAIQAQIAKVSAEREAFVQTETKKRATAGGAKTLDDALIESAKAQATKASFSC